VTARRWLKPVPQDPRYHDFADRRSLIGVPNFWNVVSNVAFFIAGLAGLQAAIQSQGPMSAAYFVFFAALVLVSFGSAWYHLAPDNSRLMWDRLPMTLAFMAFLAIVIGEQIDRDLARLLLPFLLLAGVSSVVYWRLSELRGRGDLRPYLLVQFLPLLVAPALMLLVPTPFSEAYGIWGVLGLYAAAKMFEIFDAEIFGVKGVVSGHTLKHLCAAAGVHLLAMAIGDI
jgi:hypothetical protein